jgi:hypothetical protein
MTISHLFFVKKNVKCNSIAPRLSSEKMGHIPFCFEAENFLRDNANPRWDGQIPPSKKIYNWTAGGGGREVSSSILHAKELWRLIDEETSEPEFLNFEGAQESIPRNQGCVAWRAGTIT